MSFVVLSDVNKTSLFARRSEQQVDPLAGITQEEVNTGASLIFSSTGSCTRAARREFVHSRYASYPFVPLLSASYPFVPLLSTS